MMSIEVKVPPLPESVADAVVVAWHKKPGDAIKRDENLCDLETDKVVLNVPAPADGTLVDIVADIDAVVVSGAILAHFEEGEVSSAEPAVAAESDATDAVLPLSPAVRAQVAEHQLDVSKIEGTGRDGRITKGDVLAHLDASASDAPAPTQAPVAPAQEEQRQATPATIDHDQLPAVEAPPPEPGAALGRVEQRVPMTRLRRKIAERLQEAQSTAAILTTFNEVDMHAVMALRNKFKDTFEEETGSRLGLMSFFVKASIEALKRYPIINASVDGEDIIYHGYFDIGVAVASDNGLVVPVLRDADIMNYSDIEKAILQYATQANDGTLGIDDMLGGTFSITNGGVFGSMMSTPILNPPQSAILGMHTVKDRPVVVDGEIVIRPMMYVALSYDHRIVDGKEAVQFLNTIKECLEEPARLLLQI